MADILPFKRNEFCGSLEVQERLIATSKSLRIQRLKEVRQKEKRVSDVGAEAYRQCIAHRKAIKELHGKEEKRKEKEQELQKLQRKWQSAVQESGAAHDHAKANTDILLKKSEAKSKIIAKRREEEVQREKCALKLRHEQILETQRASMRALELQHTKREIRMLDRENAHANGEAYTARLQILECQREAIAHIHSVPVVYTQTRVQQGAVSIEQRFPVEVHAQVWRHGIKGAGGAHSASIQYRAEVRNGAHVEEVTILKKTWSKVMVEMLTKIQTKKRAQTAKRTVEQHKGVLYLESELQRLEAADKAPARQTRVCSSLGVIPDAETPRLQGAFEKMFLSKPVRLDNKHIVYRTGSHLVKANLEKHVQHQHQLDEDTYTAVSPTWQSELPDLPDPRSISALYSAANQNAYEGGLLSANSSGVLSDELVVLHSDERLYQDLDGCSTASDIPMISRPPPQWTMLSNDHHLQGIDADATLELKRADQHQLQQNLEVRIPQVQPHSQAPPAKRSVPASPSPLSPASVATSPSTVASSSSSFSDAVSMKSSVDSESNSQNVPNPLTIQVKGVLDTSGIPSGSVTPPRHQSNRGSAAGVSRPIDPFTPPEVSMSNRHAQQKHVQQPLLQHRLDDEGGSPHSGASSTNTEHARHDRPQNFEPEPAPASRLSFPVLKNSDSVSQSSELLPSAPTRVTTREVPWWTDDSAVDFSKESMNMSALTEQLLPHEDEEEVMGEEGAEEESIYGSDDRSSFSSSTISQLRLAQRALSSSGSSQPSAGRSDVLSRSSRSASSSSGSSNSSFDSRADGEAASSLASGSLHSRVSSSSSSSSSMLSYLDSNKKPDSVHVNHGITLTIAGTTAPAQRHTASAIPVLSPARSLDSDSVSMLSTTSDEIRFAARGATSRSISVQDSFAHLSRQELQDVLDDIDDEEKELVLHVDQSANNQVNSVERTEHSHSHNYSQSSGGSDIQDYASMFDSDDDIDDKIPQRALSPGHPMRSGSLSHAIDRIEEESSELEQDELDQASLQSSSTGDLFENWQQLYKGTLQLGSQARTVRSEHVAAYNASYAAALSEGDSILSSQEGSPRREVTHTQPEVVPESPLNVLVFPEHGPEFSKSSLYESDLRSSDESHSSDSLSAGKDVSQSIRARAVSTITVANHRTSVDIRSSYENSNRASALMSELDKLSQDWREKQAYYSKSAASNPVVEAAPPRLHTSATPIRQPVQPPHFTSPIWLNNRNVATDMALPFGHTPSSLSSLSSVASPQGVAAPTTVHNTRQESVHSYSGKLQVHSAQGPYPVTAAHLPSLAAGLELEDSMNSSQLSGAAGDAGVGRDAYSTEGEDEDDRSEERSLEDLLSSRAGSETRGRIQSEIAAMRSRLLATVGVPEHLVNSVSHEQVALRTHSMEHTKLAAHSKSSSRSTGAHSSGDDTYSSSRYHSANEARSTSGSAMATPDSDLKDPTPAISRVSAPGATLQSTKHTSTTMNTATSARVSTTRFTSYSTQDSSSVAVDRQTKTTHGGLYDDSSRAAAYSFTKRSPEPATSSSPGVASISSVDSSLLLQQVGSPSAGSVSRLSEYAMLSQHTLHTSRGSPAGAEGNKASRDRTHQISRTTNDSYSYEFSPQINDSSTSDSSTFSEYMRHFPSRK